MRTKNTIVGVVPMGDVPEITPKLIAANIQGYLNLPTDVLPPIDLPEDAFDKGRLQYNAAAVLRAFDAMKFKGYEKVIAVLNVDLFIPIFTFVFGEAKLGGNRALVSIYRLKSAPGPAPPSSLTLERAAKVALHELGHLFNLSHCRNRRCIMYFSGELKDLDHIPFTFCRYCNTFLKDALSG